MGVRCGSEIVPVSVLVSVRVSGEWEGGREGEGEKVKKV